MGERQDPDIGIPGPAYFSFGLTPFTKIQQTIDGTPVESWDFVQFFHRNRQRLRGIGEVRGKFLKADAAQTVNAA
jgi:hypothetical protein